MMVLLTILVSMASGGLAGATISVRYNHAVRQRTLRTDFYPKLNNIYSAYMIRFGSVPDGHYWEGVVGNLPKDADKAFVERRTDFVTGLIAFNELEEARILRMAMLDSLGHETQTKGMYKVDLRPELSALDTCMKVLHKKLKLDQR